tara:strand:- start:2828 stop:3052 length:225 start_codon:yes stop_codon:yes gene_type:complete
MKDIGTVVYIMIVVVVIMMSSCGQRSYSLEEIADMQDEIEWAMEDYSEGEINYLEWEKCVKPRIYIVNKYYENQ